jgi:hypothetical protein
MQGRLPLFGVVFVDWHGVLSNEPFWASVLRGRNARLRGQLESRLNEVFAGDLATSWMRGATSVQRIIGPVQPTLSRRYRGDFLQRRLIDDCLKMAVNTTLAAVLEDLARTRFVVLATDNTADFEDAFRRAQENPSRRATATPESLRDLAPVMDDIICSSRHGVFKAEDPTAFFGMWLAGTGLDFADAVLIDDREDNCLAFEDVGGRAIRWRSDDPHAIGAVRRLRIEASNARSASTPLH